jgi:hypothetical protein
MKRCPPLWSRAVWTAMLVLLIAAGAYAQTTTGNIFGIVLTNDGAPLPGVTVTLSGIGAPQTTVTDSLGRFRFINLSPGSYSLRAELAGFGQASRAGVGVNIGRNSEVSMTLNPAVAQTITVTAEAPLLDVRRTGTGATMTSVELEAVPTGRDPWVVLQQTPGVLMDRINVGGNESGQQSQFVSKGASGDQTSWNVDGVNITDVGALGSSPTYYDFDSFEEMQITTGGTDIRILTPGAQVNMVTKRGTNDLSGSARYLTTRSAWQATPEIPAEARTYLGTVNEIDDIRDMGVEAGGPIIRDRLWLWGAYSEQQIDLLVAQPFGQTDRFADKTTLETFNAKLNAQPFTSNSLTIAAMIGNKIKLGRNIGPTRPPETAWNQDSSYSGPTMWKIEDTHVFSPNFYLTGLYSQVQGGFQLISDNGRLCNTFECGVDAPPAILNFGDDDYPIGAWKNSFYNYYTERPQDQGRLDGSFFFNTGGMAHELRFGFGYRDAEVRSVSAWPGNQFLVNYDPFNTPGGEGGVYLSRPTDFTYNVKSTDFYVGDTILLGNLTLQAGVRWDVQKGSLLDSSVGPNPSAPDLLPAISVRGADFGTLKWDSISPRIGLTYALGADRRTLLRAAANRYTDQLGGYTVYAVSPIGYNYLYYYYSDINANMRVDPGEVLLEDGILGWLGVDPDNPTAPVRRWASNLDAPYTDEFLLGAERELVSNFVVGATATWRKLNDFIFLRPEKSRGSGNYYTSADYMLAPAPATGTLPDGTAYSLPYYILRPGVAPPTYYVFDNQPGYHQTYQGLELTANKRMSNRWMMRGSVTLQDWKQHVRDEAIVDPTRTRFCSTCDDSIVMQGSGTGSGAKGGIYINSKWAYNVTGAYQIPFVETTLGFNLTGREGYPIPYVHRVGTSEGSKLLLATESPDTYRHSDIMNLDLRLAKDLHFGPVGTTLSIEVFNVTNEQTILQRNVTRLNQRSRPQDDPNPSSNRITEMQSPRVFRVGARFTF